MEGREAELVEGRRLPAVAPPGRAVAVDHRAARGEALADLAELNAAGRGRREGVDRAGERDPSRRADGRVVVAEEVAGLERPGHELGVEAEPLARERFEEAGGLAGGGDPGDERGLAGGVAEEGPAGAGVDDPLLAVFDPEAAGRGLARAGDDDHRPRAHVLLLADDLADALTGEVVEGLVGSLEERRTLGAVADGDIVGGR